MGWTRAQELQAELDELAHQIHQLHTDIAATVAGARAEGMTWQQIGELFGISRQAAHERFSQPRS